MPGEGAAGWERGDERVGAMWKGEGRGKGGEGESERRD